jgi:hypothetical protein
MPNEGINLNSLKRFNLKEVLIIMQKLQIIKETRIMKLHIMYEVSEGYKIGILSFKIENKLEIFFNTILKNYFLEN